MPREVGRFPAAQRAPWQPTFPRVKKLICRCLRVRRASRVSKPRCPGTARRIDRNSALRSTAANRSSCRGNSIRQKNLRRNTARCSARPPARMWLSTAIISVRPHPVEVAEIFLQSSSNSLHVQLSYGNSDSGSLEEIAVHVHHHRGEVLGNSVNWPRAPRLPCLPS